MQLKMNYNHYIQIKNKMKKRCILCLIAPVCGGLHLLVCCMNKWEWLIDLKVN